MIQDTKVQAQSDKAFIETDYKEYPFRKTLWDMAFEKGYEAGYSAGHEDQMKMRIQDAIENKKA